LEGEVTMNFKQFCKAAHDHNDYVRDYRDYCGGNFVDVFLMTRTRVVVIFQDTYEQEPRIVSVELADLESQLKTFVPTKMDENDDFAPSNFDGDAMGLMKKIKVKVSVVKKT